MPLLSSRLEPAATECTLTNLSFGIRLSGPACLLAMEVEIVDKASIEEHSDYPLVHIIGQDRDVPYMVHVGSSRRSQPPDDISSSLR